MSYDPDDDISFGEACALIIAGCIVVVAIILIVYLFIVGG